MLHFTNTELSFKEKMKTNVLSIALKFTSPLVQYSIDYTKNCTNRNMTCNAHKHNQERQ